MRGDLTLPRAAQRLQNHRARATVHDEGVRLQLLSGTGSEAPVRIHRLRHLRLLLLRLLVCLLLPQTHVVVVRKLIDHHLLLLLQNRQLLRCERLAPVGSSCSLHLCCKLLLQADLVRDRKGQHHV